MLKLLKIRDFAIISELEIEFDRGFTAITGETGAGKSLLLGAIRLLLGDRASADIVRAGAAKSRLEALLSSVPTSARNWLAEQGIGEDQSVDEVILRREISASGVSRHFINGNVVTLAQLRQFGEGLIDLHGQNEHTSLVRPEVQLELLDAFGDCVSLRDTYRQCYEEWQTAVRRRDALVVDARELERKRSFLRFQVEEIEAAHLSVGEEEELTLERARLQSAERLREIALQATDVLYEGEKSGASVGALVASVARMLAQAENLDPTLSALRSQAEELRFAVEDLASRLRDYGAQLVSDPARLEWVEERLELIRVLKRKYGNTIEEILQVGHKLRAELDELENYEVSLATAEAEVEQALKSALSAAHKLRARRLEVAREFSRQVTNEMQDLSLGGAEFVARVFARRRGCDSSGVDVEYSPDFAISEEIAGEELGPTGAEQVEFVVKLNPGEPALPLRKVASGGELSRIMLAVKAVLAEKDQIPVLIFDEVDTGISGEAATRVGEKLASLGTSHQVLCVTHLPQIAARADQHIVIRKGEKGGRTVVTAELLQGSARERAIAEMLSGQTPDAESLRYAKRLLTGRR